MDDDDDDPRICTSLLHSELELELQELLMKAARLT